MWRPRVSVSELNLRLDATFSQANLDLLKHYFSPFLATRLLLRGSVRRQQPEEVLGGARLPRVAGAVGRRHQLRGQRAGVLVHRGRRERQ